MTLRTVHVLVVASWVLAVGSFVFLAFSASSGMEDNLFQYQGAVVGLVFPALGWLVLRRQRSHPVGWIVVVAGLSGALGAFGEEYVTVGFELYPGSLPAVELVAWLGSWTWAFFFGLLPIFLLVFPDGRLLSPRWRPVLWVASVPPVFLPALLAVMTWGLPVEVLASSDEPDFPRALAGMSEVGILVLAGSLLAALVSLGMRWRQSTGVTRQQLKVFFLFAAAGILCLILSQLEIPASDLFGVVAFLLVPGGMVAAILRHRLYEIDQVISRTVSYALLSAMLGGLFVASVFLLRTALPLEGQFPIAVSTLAVAALFNPLRSRLQRGVNRSFNRSRYNAGATIESFSRMVRTDLPDVMDVLVSVTAQTMEPAHLTLWLREGDRDS